MGSSSPVSAIPGEGRPEEALDGPLEAIGTAMLLLLPLSRALPALAVGFAWLRGAAMAAATRVSEGKASAAVRSERHTCCVLTCE